MTKKQTFASIISLAFVLVLLIYPHTSRSSEVDSGHWNALFFQNERAPEQKWGWVMELQTRLHTGDPGSNRFNRILARPAVRYYLSPNWQLWFGHAWTPTMTPFRGEHRLWQQILFQDEILTRSQHTHRLRFEQRQIQDAGSVAFRLRYFGRFGHWFDESKSWGWLVWDEAFWALNTVVNGPSSGFDQNRAFAGFQWMLGKKCRLEAGYLNIYSRFANNPRDWISHNLGTYAYFDF